MFTAAIVLFIISIGLSEGQDCTWNKDLDFPSSYPPLLVDSASWTILEPALESGDRIVRVPNNALVVVACPGNTIAALGSTESVEGRCVGGSNLDVAGDLYTINGLECSSSVDDYALPLPTVCGNGGIGNEISIGFDIIGRSFVEIIRVCFEPVQQITLYTNHLIHGGNIYAGDGNPDRPSFVQQGDDFYTVESVNNCYLTAGQDVFFEDLTGDPNYIDTGHSVYFSRGHLAPNAAFVTEMEADATFYYMNAIPQWQPYNGGNWMYLESDARALADTYGYDFQIWTGPMPQLKIADTDGTLTPVYICDTQSLDLIPIPSQIWKVVYDPVRDLGITVITSNTPHEEPIVEHCTRLDCGSIVWLSFDYSSTSKGYTYCCSVQNFKTFNPHAPDLPTAGVLTQ